MSKLSDFHLLTLLKRNVLLERALKYGYETNDEPLRIFWHDQMLMIEPESRYFNMLTDHPDYSQIIVRSDRKTEMFLANFVFREDHEKIWKLSRFSDDPVNYDLNNSYFKACIALYRCAVRFAQKYPEMKLEINEDLFTKW